MIMNHFFLINKLQSIEHVELKKRKKVKKIKVFLFGSPWDFQSFNKVMAYI